MAQLQLMIRMCDYCDQKSVASIVLPTEPRLDRNDPKYNTKADHGKYYVRRFCDWHWQQLAAFLEVNLHQIERPKVEAPN